MATPTTTKRKPVFVKVDQLKPGTNGHTLTVKVVSSKPVKTVSTRGARRSIVGARGAPVAHRRVPRRRRNRNHNLHSTQRTGVTQIETRKVDHMNAGATVILRNAKIDMFKGSMRLAVDKWGRIEPTDPANFEVKEDNNLSLVEYELVNVVEE
ncbi:Hypothetical protein glysoja_001391 [Glycine soja]|nr:Hypothetical protein glysoja_001391 [Glycine soja]